MNKRTKNNGITLISLVITIIIMLILVGVSITLAVNGALFEYAGNAVGDTRNAMKNEQDLINDIINNYIKPNVPEIPEGLKVGDYVNYTPTTETYRVADGENGSGYTTDEGYQEFTTDTTLKWRVWSIDEKTGQIELISDKATHELHLNGADGYIAETEPYVTETYYGFDGSKQTYYPDKCLNATLGVNTAPTGLINLEKEYWLASRCVGKYDYYTDFRMRFVAIDGAVGGILLINSYGYHDKNDECPNFAVRSIVHLPSSTQFTKITSDGELYWNVNY